MKITNPPYEADPQEIEVFFQRINFYGNNFLAFCNLQITSYAAICGNTAAVKHLVIDKNCNINMTNSSDCNLLTWASLCPEKFDYINLIDFIQENKIYCLFDDETNEGHIDALLQKNLDLDQVEQLTITHDGLTAFFYLLLSPNIISLQIREVLARKKIQEIIQDTSNLNNDYYKRRMARYYYIAGYHLKRNQLEKLTMEAYNKAISKYEMLEKKLSSDMRELAYIYNSLGRIYCNSAQWEQALECYQKAVMLHTKIKEKLLIDHQDLANYRSNLSGYPHDATDENYFTRFALLI